MSEETNELTDEQREAELAKATTLAGPGKGRTKRAEPAAPPAEAAAPVGTFECPDGRVVPLYDPPAFDDEGRLVRGAAHQLGEGRVQVEP